MKVKISHYPSLKCAIAIQVNVETLPGGGKLGGPPTFRVSYANCGDVATYSAFLLTYCQQEDPQTKVWSHTRPYRKEPLTIYPAGEGAFEYPAPKFLSQVHFTQPAQQTQKNMHEEMLKMIKKPWPKPAGIRYYLAAMIFDPIFDPLPQPVEAYFAKHIIDRHVAYTSIYTSWPTG